jgi:Ca2+-binding RTX toxin-like protein
MSMTLCSSYASSTSSLAFGCSLRAGRRSLPRWPRGPRARDRGADGGPARTQLYLVGGFASSATDDDTLAGINTVIGTDFDDTLLGDGSNNSLTGGSGDDTIKGAGGDDLGVGSGGADTVRGGAGEDDLYGKAGPDGPYGGSGDDLCVGGKGDDILKGCEL